MSRFLFFCSILLMVLAGVFASCSREYSFEGSDNTNAPIPLPVDTTAGLNTGANLDINSCAGCTTDLVENKWSLKINDALLCGDIDTAIVSADRNAFTFFGPSFCSLDSGLIISARLDDQLLNQNRQNLQIQKASIYYYDKVGGLYVVQSEQGKPFLLTISSYDHITKSAEGSFAGAGFTKHGKAIAVKDGQWKTHFR